MGCTTLLEAPGPGQGGHLGLNLIQSSRGFAKHGKRRIGLLLRALPLETDLALVSVVPWKS